MLENQISILQQKIKLIRKGEKFEAIREELMGYTNGARI